MASSWPYFSMRSWRWWRLNGLSVRVRDGKRFGWEACRAIDVCEIVFAIFTFIGKKAKRESDKIREAFN